ncbi:MAG: tRNA (adenosine(37)-N6)-threonylcarbamoyltransferase complex dimerization subunit type 1 TsaB [Candidatus Omnitrophota bacterium]
MNILCIDTSTEYLSIGILFRGQVLSTVDIHAKLRTSDIIIPTIHKLLKKYKLKLVDFDAFSVGLGPGSFTGLRIATATIKALSFCMNKKIIGICSLDLIAYNVREDGNICVIIDAKRNLLYSGFYKKKNGLITRQWFIKLLSVDSVLNICRDKIFCAPTYFLGNGLGIYRDKIRNSLKNSIILDEAFWYPRAKNLCLAAKQMYRDKKFISIDKLKPLYIYPKHCQVRK